MTILLLDTNIISYMIKSDSRAILYATNLEQDKDHAISLMSFAEFLQWAGHCQWGVKRLDRFEMWLNDTYTILPIDYELCNWWAKVRLECQDKG